MKLALDRVKESPTSQRFEGGGEWWADAQQTVPELRGELAEQVAVDLRSYRAGADIYLEGVLAGAFDLACARCLARYRHQLREPFRLVLEPAGARVPPEPAAARDLARYGMCLGDELETGWFQGREIDLGAYFLEIIALAVPVQPLCREECRGLCPRCGIDRNLETCECGAPRSPSPFAVLGALRGSADEGES